MRAAACVAGLLLAVLVPATTPADSGPGMAVPQPGTFARPAAGNAAACALLLTGEDDAGSTVMQSIAYALDAPGTALAPRHAVTGSVRWSRLAVRADSGAPDDAGAPPLEASGGFTEDPQRDLVWLRVPGLPSCATGDHAGALGGLEAGTPLVGLRNREGYRPRVFPASVERRLRLGGETDLLLVRVPDGGGAEEGFLLDERLRLVATILPPPPGADSRYACAVPYGGGPMANGAPGGRPGEDGGVAGAGGVAGPAGGAGGDDPLRLMARALLLTRDDQAQEAIGLLDQVARLAGPSPALLVERGQRNHRIGRSEAAIRDFAAAALADPGMHLARFNLGVALGSEGRYREAAGAFAEALRLRPDHPRTLFHFALALRAAGLLDRARGELDRLSGIDPDLAEQLRPIIGL